MFLIPFLYMLSIFSSVKLPKLPKKVKVIDYPKNKKILIVSPHSDDISVSCGVTISKLAGKNNIVPVLFFSGYRGLENKEPQKATLIREQEMKKETKLLKIHNPIFLRLQSYETQKTNKKDIQKVKQLIKQQNPEIIFLPKKDDQHPSHRLATKITLEALGKKHNIDLYFYENPWSLFKTLEFNIISIFSRIDLLKNLKIIRVHKSQLKRTRFDRTARTLAAFRGAVIPEQRIFGYGKKTIDMQHIYIETFKYENNSNK